MYILKAYKTGSYNQAQLLCQPDTLFYVTKGIDVPEGLEQQGRATLYPREELANQSVIEKLKQIKIWGK